MTRLVLGVDLGTTGCRACVAGGSQEAVASGAAVYEPERPRPGWAEQDPEAWWLAVCEAVREAVRGGLSGRLEAVAVSSQSTALVPVDEALRPVRKAIIWQDARSAPQCEAIAARFGAGRVRDVIGWPPSTFLVWPKVLWFMEREPELFARTKWLLQAGGFVTCRMGAEPLMDRSSAVGYPMQLEGLKWDGEMCSWGGFPTGKVPPIAAPGSVIGRLSAGAAAECGLPEGLAIVAGGMDTACAALAVGALRAGCAFEVSGTSGGIGIVSEAPSGERRLGVAPHPLEGLYINHAPMSAAGASLAWCREVLCGGEPYESMERAAAGLEDEPTGLVFLPYLAGERAPVWDARARGALAGLTLATSRAQVIKAVMEGVGYALRQNIDIAESAGQSVTELRSCGGGSRSALWCQVKADVTGRRLIVHPGWRDAAFGAALLAGMGAGMWGLEAAARGHAQVYEPRAALTARYARYQPAYNALYTHLSDGGRAPS